MLRRVVVATPSSLCQNWAAEARKWLGEERLRVLLLQAGAEAAGQAHSFCRTEIAGRRMSNQYNHVGADQAEILHLALQAKIAP